MNVITRPSFLMNDLSKYDLKYDLKHDLSTVINTSLGSPGAFTLVADEVWSDIIHFIVGWMSTTDPH